MRIEAILLDLDGTIVDSFRDIYRALGDAAEDLGAQRPSEGSVRALLHLRLDQLVPRLMPQLNAQDVIDRFRAHYDGGSYVETAPYPQVERTMRELARRNVKLFVVTNKRRMAAEAILDRLGLCQYIKGLATADDTDPPSDKASLVARLLASHSLQVERTILVGDTISDREAAEANGLRFVLAAYGYGGPESRGPNFAPVRISHFGQLLDVCNSF